MEHSKPKKLGMQAFETILLQMMEQANPYLAITQQRQSEEWRSGFEFALTEYLRGLLLRK